jgi:hypothetical protein
MPDDTDVVDATLLRTTDAPNALWLLTPEQLEVLALSPDSFTWTFPALVLSFDVTVDVPDPKMLSVEFFPLAETIGARADTRNSKTVA